MEAKSFTALSLPVGAAFEWEPYSACDLYMLVYSQQG